jgi:hypothetical protein
MRIDPAPPAVRIDWIGPIAAGMLRGATPRASTAAAFEPSRSGFVAAVLQRCIYVECSGAFVCIGMPDIGRGPLNAMVGSAVGSWWLELVRDGEPVRLSPGGISGAAWRIDASQAREWRPAPWPAAAAADAIAVALAVVRQYAGPRMPADGLAPLVLAATDAIVPSPLGRIAAPRLVALRRWLAAPDALLPPVDLLGLGPGLTPSGDDCLSGVLLALDALGASSSRLMLAKAVAEAAPHATTPLSASFLSAAAEGYANEALHRFIATLLRADRAGLTPAIAALVRTGHTSGWDALAGVVLAFSASVERHLPPKSP